ncbi:MAG: hypothetical protein R3C03_20945 [Pirellulaceae bacterium]
MTRDTQNVHRATRYCHWFASMPTGGTGKTTAMSVMLKINRAKEHSPTINRTKVSIDSKLKNDGYELAMFIPGALLNGWDPSEHPRIGLFASVVDQEFGPQTLSVGGDMPFEEDPSLWCSADLAE